MIVLLITGSDMPAITFDSAAICSASLAVVGGYIQFKALGGIILPYANLAAMRHMVRMLTTASAAVAVPS